MLKPDHKLTGRRMTGPSVQITRRVYGLSNETQPRFINKAWDAGVRDIGHVSIDLKSDSQVTLVAAGEVSRLQKLSGEPISQAVMDGLAEHLENRLVGSFKDLHFLQAKPVDEKQTTRQQKVNGKKIEVDTSIFVTAVDPDLKRETKLARIATCEYFGLDFEDVIEYENIFTKPGTSRLLIATVKFENDINIVRQLIADSSLVQEQYILAPVESKVVNVTID